VRKSGTVEDAKTVGPVGMWDLWDLGKRKERRKEEKVERDPEACCFSILTFFV